MALLYDNYKLANYLNYYFQLNGLTTENLLPVAMYQY